MTLKENIQMNTGYETHTWPDETSGSLLEEERYETQTWPDEKSDSSLEEENDEKQSCTEKKIEKAKTLKDTVTLKAKTDVMREASEQIKTKIDENAFCLRAELFPLSDEEKKKILEYQFKLAKQLKGVRNPDIDATFETIKDRDNSCAIGFPLRADLYAFETELVNKTKDIFTDPVSYVIRHLKREIVQDKDSSAKTLFLFLLFYTSPNSFKPGKKLDLRYGKDLQEYLEDPKVVPKNLLKEIGPLNFENLPTKAEHLQYTILVKQSTMFEFKHQIYLDGASDYFLRKYPEAAVCYFPLDFIRQYAFSDAPISVWGDLIKRFKRELQENKYNCCTEKEIEYRKIPEVLSCKIFDTVQFQSKFGKEFKDDSSLNWLFFTKEVRFAFWAKRFGRKQLLEAALIIAKEHYDFQFYQGLYGEFCEKEEKYDADPDSLIDLELLKERVWKFKAGDGRSILHLVLCSDRSDYEAYSVLGKIFTDASEYDVMLISDLLKCASEYLICSRILCLLELLRKQNESFSKQTPTDVSNVIAQLRICTDYDAHLELEFLVRICIVLANGEASAKKVYTDYNSVDERFRHVRKLLDGNETTQSKISKIINDCIAECQTSSLPCPETKKIPFTNIFTLELKQAIHDSVQVLSRQERLM